MIFLSDWIGLILNIQHFHNKVKSALQAVVRLGVGGGLGLEPATEGSLQVSDAVVRLGAASPQQGDLRLSSSPSGQDAGGGARTRDRRVPADLRADSLATMPPTPPDVLGERTCRPFL
ncbi:hypothetical protein PoB_000938000 [Plakobranchus ocellatus]|uniref:Uncharacterized protein n=1 Tax=Plakobranchus ocellatus TaxID=259542 RepID=A0AAV3YJH3_9GAST|nr:hypothetical protein PoB_000938000 [Plakobranchus ocellatus]